MPRWPCPGEPRQAGWRQPQGARSTLARQQPMTRLAQAAPGRARHRQRRAVRQARVAARVECSRPRQHPAR
eukprot:13176993-Alexandrium_andersonii.AAC.1